MANRVQTLPQYGKHVHRVDRMQAVVIDRYGSADLLRYTDVPVPSIRPKQALVKTQFIGVNPKDVMVRKGKFAFLTGKKFPLIVGHDIAGVVVKSGSQCDLSVGDQVYGMINDLAGRAYAEYAAVNSSELGRMPRGVSAQDAAAVPLAAQTALQALRDDGRLSRGQRVLINGASGGVGTFAVQIAKILGAHVTAVCSARNKELVQELGADEHIDYSTTDLPSHEGRYDVIFDVFGNYSFGELKHQLNTPGRFVHTLPTRRIVTEVVLTALRKKRARMVVVRSRRTQLDWLSTHLDAGRLRAVVDRTFDLADAAEAHRFMETKRARGKVVLAVPERDIT